TSGGEMSNLGFGAFLGPARRVRPGAPSHQWQLDGQVRYSLDSRAPSEKMGVGVSGSGLVGPATAPGAAAGAPDSAARRPRRIRLPAGRGDLLPGTRDEPATPHVGALRNF